VRTRRARVKRGWREWNWNEFGQTPVVFHRLNFPAGLCAIDQFAPLGLLIAFLNMSRQRTAFLVGPAFLGVLSFKSAAEDIFDARITAAGKAFVDERLQVRWDV